MTDPVKIIGSHTFMGDYENCPSKAYHKFVLRDIPYVATPEMAWGNHVHDAAEKRLTTGAPFSAELNYLEPIAQAIMSAGRVEGERKVACRADWSPCGFYDTDVKWRGKIDVTVEQSGSTAVILDWKTGKEREEPEELQLHAVLLKQRRPELQRIIGHYIWVRGCKLGEAHDLSDFELRRATYDKKMAHVENNARLNHWPARENPLCKWCDVLACPFNKKGK